MADETNTNAQAQAVNNGAQQTAPEIDYGKIEAMINKGAQQKENAILKSYFEQMGMDEDGIKTAVNEYKTKQAEAKKQQTADVENMKAENEKLKKQITADKINSKATSVALDMGVDKNTVQYVIKLADMSKAIDEKGEVSEESVKSAIEQVLKDVPAFKASAQSKGFVQVGAGKEQTDADKTDELYKLFGIKTKKE